MTAARGQSLAVRLALPLAGGVVIVLLLVGLVVNRVVSTSFEETLSDEQQQRLELAAAALDQLQASGRTGAVEVLLHQVAMATRGWVELRDASGTAVAHAGRLPRDVPTQTIEQPLTDGVLLIEVPARPPDRSFPRVFNTTLVVAGALTVAVLLLLTGLLANRLTRPLRALTDAAHRLGSGDLTVRAGGGPDRESTELAGAFNGMADRLERSEMLRRRAASDMAHDLATPATVLESQLQAMVDGVVPADREQLERARAAASALSGVILQLGELTSAEAAPLQRQPERVDVADLLRGVAASLGLGIPVSVDSASFVHADPAQLQRAVRNVLANAVPHSPSVEITGAAGRIEIRIIDRGPGIAADHLPHIFERFYRADPARAGGSGIGLTIARELLAANGGEIRVERTGPDGTTFLLTLPAA